MSTREKLVQATAELLWERGYVGTSPRAIQRASGAGQGSMYHHFAGKAELAEAAIEWAADQLRTQTEQDLANGATALERLTGYLTRERQALLGCRLGRLAQDPDVIADPRLRRPVADYFRWLRATLTDVITTGQASGELRAGTDPAALASALAAAVQGGYVLARADQDADNYRQAIQGLVTLVAQLGGPD